MSQQLSEKDIQIHLEAFKALGLNPAQMQAKNSFDPTLKGPRADTVRMWMQEHHPAYAAESREKFGEHTLSMAAAAYNAGVGERTNAVHQELFQNSSVYQKQYEANVKANEERILADMENKVREARISRGEDPDAVEVINPHLAGRHFRGYAERVNLEARQERNAKQ
jgi:hypothetical protein